MSEATIFFIADPADPGYPLDCTIPLVDLNELEEDCLSGWLLHESDPIITHNFQATDIGSFPFDGDTRAIDRHANSRMDFRLHYIDTSTPDAVDMVRTLADALEASRVIVLQRPGQTEARQYDYDPGLMPQLLRGNRARFFQDIAKLDPDGIPVSLSIYPWPRLAPITFGPVEVDNSTTGRDVLLTNDGDLDGDLILKVAPTAGDLCQIGYGLRAYGNKTEFATLYAQAATDGSDRVDTSDAAVTDATGGNAKVITFTTSEDLEHRFRLIDTPADQTAIEKRFRLLARISPTGGSTDSEFEVQGRVGFTSDALAMHSLGRHRLDFRETPNDFVIVSLGFFNVPRGAERIVVDFYAKRRSGDRHLAVDMRILEPADYQRGRLTVPGFQHGRWGHRRFDSEDLDGTGALRKGMYRLDTQNEVARTEPNAGFALQAGTYAVTVEALLREPDDPAGDDPNPPETVLASFDVMDDATVSGGLPNTVRKTANLRTRRNQNKTHVERTIYFVVSSADEAAGRKFQFRVKQTATTLSGRRILVDHFRMKFMRGIDSSSVAVLDSYHRKAHVTDTDDNFQFPLHHSNTPLKLPPGDSLLVLDLLDMPTDPDYEHVDRREHLGKSVLSRAASVSGKVIPRVRL